MNRIKNSDRILLLLLPFWTPFIPPLGITTLKAFLKENDIDAEAIDLNLFHEFWILNKRYFNTLNSYVNRSTDSYNEKHIVQRNHLMAFVNAENTQQYFDVVRSLVKIHCFVIITNDQIAELNQIIQEIFDTVNVQISRIIERIPPTKVGFSVNKSTLALSLYAAKLIKKNYPKIETIMGGAFFFGGDFTVGSSLFKLLDKRTPYIDRMIIGEGELILLEFLKGNLPDKKILTLQDIEGKTLNINKAVLPDFSGIKPDDYYLLATYGSRSCPFECSFCTETVLWGKYRKKKPACIAEEMAKISSRFGKKLFLLCDSLLNPTVDGLSNELINRSNQLYWDGYLRADKEVCHLEKAKLWRKGGLCRVRLGLESGSAHVLKLMNKKINPNQIENAVSNLASVGIKTSTYWVVGHPEETEKDFQATLNLLERQKENIFEAKCNAFNLYLTGQVNSDKWARRFDIYPLYTKEMQSVLIHQIFHLRSNPSREEILDRVRRFHEHCKKLGIPDPTNIEELHEADQRWIRIRENAAPPFLEINEGGLIDKGREIM